MRFDSYWRSVVVGSFLVAAFHGSPLRAEDDAASLKFLTVTPASFATESSQTSPSPVQPAPHEPTTIPSPQSEQPESQPPTTVPPLPPPTYPRPGAATRVIRQPLFEPPLTNQTRQALNFYGGYSARATLSQLPRRAPIQSSPPRPVVRQTKPFETIHQEPTVSPYLNLHRDDDSAEGAPNYFAFVRPQIEQLDAARMQQREIQQLYRQLQNMPSTAAGPRYGAGGGSGGAARFMDTAQFYAGWRR